VVPLSWTDPRFGRRVHGGTEASHWSPGTKPSRGLRGRSPPEAGDILQFILHCENTEGGFYAVIGSAFEPPTPPLDPLLLF